MNMVLFGYLLAIIEGGLLALWGLSSKELALEVSGFNTYGLVLVLSALGHFGLILILDRGSHHFTGDPLSRSSKFLLSVFVLISCFQFYLGVYVYEDPEADLSVSSFLRNSSLPFIAFLAHFGAWSGGVFKESRLKVYSLIGIFLFILASWFFVDATQFRSSIFAPWILLSLLIGFNRAITELLMQGFAAKLKRHQVNAALGLGLLIVGAVLFLLKPMWPDLSLNGWMALFGVSLIIPLMQLFRFHALLYMNEILAKKGITILSYFVSSIFLGWLAYSEPITLTKILGLLIGLSAVTFLDDDFRKLFWRRQSLNE